ncbi:F-box/kelch-repeat protein At1g57790-like [Abrus precatorius]|uniref:F-box/kelch-repeat protein At1g57790-like n=1 Tax=Abrus precatorius TaxID=3816 RepID=A0A8B8K349_ABRPR|nr:F-box/kelch-repeat protein At1g57790-like [Abrus precatorius]
MESQWSNLPYDLLSRIARDLELIDFLSFRGVCRDWNIASSKTSPQDKSRESDLWFLTYGGGEGSQCSLLNNGDKVYSISIPELEGATCLASYDGWLLLFCQGSMFFFCPFSRAKIELPNCPFTELTNHVAAFSSAPTSQDCTVAVISRSHERDLELFVLCRGDNEWGKHTYHSDVLETIRAAIFYEEKFHFLDGFDILLTFDAAKTKEWNTYRIVTKPRASTVGVLNYRVRKDYFGKKDIKRKLGLEEDVSISICGTQAPSERCGYKEIIQSESIEATAEATAASQSRDLKGIWIRPRYHVHPDQKW